MQDPTLLSMGSSSVVYISIPDPTATSTAGTNCAGIGLISTTSTAYHCAGPSTLTQVNGTGWVPINFTAIPGGASLSSLPTDPINSTSSNEYLVYKTDGTGGYELMAQPAAPKDVSSTTAFVRGTDLSLLPSFPTTGGSSGVASGGNIWVTDSANDRVEEFSASGTYESEFNTSGSPANLAIYSNGTLFWLATGPDDNVQEFSATGFYHFQFGSYGTGNGQFDDGYDLAIDSSGNLWVTDIDNNRVQEFSAGGRHPGTYESQFGSSGMGNGQFNGPTGIAIDASGNIWVTDTAAERVQEFSPGGTVKSQFGSAGSGNGQFEGPTGITID